MQKIHVLLFAAGLFVQMNQPAEILFETALRTSSAYCSIFRKSAVIWAFMEFIENFGFPFLLSLERAVAAVRILFHSEKISGIKVIVIEISIAKFSFLNDGIILQILFSMLHRVSIISSLDVVSNTIRENSAVTKNLNM